MKLIGVFTKLMLMGVTKMFKTSLQFIMPLLFSFPCWVKTSGFTNEYTFHLHQCLSGLEIVHLYSAK